MIHNLHTLQSANLINQHFIVLFYKFTFNLRLNRSKRSQNKMAPMFRHRKLLIYRRLKNKLRLRDLDRRVNFYENIQYSQDQLEQLSIAQYIQTLDPSSKKKFHDQHPDLSDLLFLNEQQKVQYFEMKNQGYFKKLQHEHHRHSKTKKHVKFNDKFEVKYFNNEGSTQEIAIGQVQQEPYHFGVHFSH